MYLITSLNTHTHTLTVIGTLWYHHLDICALSKIMAKEMHISAAHNSGIVTLKGHSKQLTVIDGNFVYRCVLFILETLIYIHHLHTDGLLHFHVCYKSLFLFLIN